MVAVSHWSSLKAAEGLMENIVLIVKSVPFQVFRCHLFVKGHSVIIFDVAGKQYVGGIIG